MRDPAAEQHRVRCRLWAIDVAQNFVGFFKRTANRDAVADFEQRADQSDTLLVIAFNQQNIALHDYIPLAQLNLRWPCPARAKVRKRMGCEKKTKSHRKITPVSPGFSNYDLTLVVVCARVAYRKKSANTF
jgi:hypothetical protein